MAAQSQSLAASLTAQTFTFGFFSDQITIENNDVGTAYIRTDGTAAVADAAGTLSVAPGQTLIVENLGAAGLPNANAKSGAAVYYCGVEKSFSQSEAVNWTVQSASTGAGLTVVSMITTGTPTGEWTVTAE